MTNLYSRYWKKWEISVNELFIYYLITLAYYKGGGGSSLTGKATKPMKIYTVIHIFLTGVFAGQFWSLGLIFDTPDLNCPDIAASLF